MLQAARRCVSARATPSLSALPTHNIRSTSSTSSAKTKPKRRRKKREDAEGTVRMGVGAQATLDTHLHKLERPSKPPPKLVPKKAEIAGTQEEEATSLIPETLKGMEEDDEFQLTAQNLRKFGQKKLTLDEKKMIRRSLEDTGLPEFESLLQQQSLHINRLPAEVLQMNIGLYCNQACAHCHVESSPKRSEMMSREVADKCLELLSASPSVHTVDITGHTQENRIRENISHKTILYDFRWRPRTM